MRITHTNGTISVVNIETYLTRHRVYAMVRMALEHMTELAELCHVDEIGIQAIVVDYIRVSLRVDTNHSLSKYLCEPTVRYEDFKTQFLDFLRALMVTDNGVAFEEMVKLVNEIDTPQTEPHQHPTPPDDPN